MSIESTMWSPEWAEVEEDCIFAELGKLKTRYSFTYRVI